MRLDSVGAGDRETIESLILVMSRVMETHYVSGPGPRQPFPQTRSHSYCRP